MSIQSTKSYLILLLGLIVSLTSSCTTLLHGPNQQLYVNSIPQGAHITINGKSYGETPQVISLRWKEKTAGEKIKNKDFKIDLVREGYPTYSTVIHRKLNPLYFGNIALLTAAPIGFIWDASNGSMYKLNPSQIIAPLSGTVSPAETTSPDSFTLKKPAQWLASVSADYISMKNISSNTSTEKDNLFTSLGISLTYVKSPKTSYRITHSMSLAASDHYDVTIQQIFPVKEYQSQVTEKWWINDTRLELLVRLNKLSNHRSLLYFTAGIGARAVWNQSTLDSVPTGNYFTTPTVYLTEGNGAKVYDDLWLVITSGLRAEKRIKNFSLFLEPALEAASIPDVVGGGEGLSLRYRISFGAGYYFGRKTK